MKVYIKNRKRRKDEFQFFMHDFVEGCKKAGINDLSDILPSYRFHIRAILRSILLFIYKRKLLFQHTRNCKSAVVVTTSGGTIIDNSFPYFFNREVIPVVWDNWPPSFHKFVADLKLLNCRLVFVTVKSHADYINQKMGIKAYWLPEGINSEMYSRGEDLDKRPYDVFEMGRQMPAYHKIIEGLNQEGMLSGLLYSNSKDKGGSWMPLEELISEIPKYKVMICFPRCDTNPKAKGVETLTQRYWEAMLCRCLIIGRAPGELVELCGYNPVIDVEWENPKEQLVNILNHIGIYQKLVDKNYEFAQKNADWKWRMPFLIDKLKLNNYQIQ